MTNAELLKTGRDMMLGLHRSLMEFERSIHEETHGRATPGQFLGLLLEDPGLAWLRRFSMLIVEVDEMFAQRDGFGEEAVEAHLLKMKEIVFMADGDEEFLARYRNGLQQNVEAAAIHGQLRHLLRDERD